MESRKGEDSRCQEFGGIRPAGCSGGDVVAQTDNDHILQSRVSLGGHAADLGAIPRPRRSAVFAHWS